MLKKEYKELNYNTLRAFDLIGKCLLVNVYPLI